MAGETDLEKLIANMEPVLNEGDYVFATVANLDEIPRSVTICEIKEIEGVTIVLSKYDADRLNISYDYVAAWITLNIHSSLDAVGLTAAFSAALGNNGISCNVIAGYYHDHIFVPKQDKINAIKVLWDMTKCI
ncbi:MAG: hypothetical protein ACJA1A_000298 [Saprospiraceae bacterium]|jgi:hypothetical protein|tara:strand:- start:757 stop:1155 length:399 start_codon:yes stop_codon:yes gene_type:complete